MIEENLKKNFEIIKKKYGYIPLKKISLSKDVEYANIDMKNFEIKINPDYIYELNQKIEIDRLIQGIIEHEVGHYLFHPHSLKRVILESNAVSELKFGEEIRQFYDDVNNNLRILNKDRNSPIVDIYRHNKNKSDFEILILNLYQDLTGIDFKVKKTNNDFNLNQLKNINYLNINKNTLEYVKKNEKQNISDLLNFYKAVIKIYEKDSSENNSPVNIFGKTPKTSDFKISDKKAELSKIIKEGVVTNPKQIIENMIPELSEVEANLFLYESLSNKYNIKIIPTPIVNKIGAYPTKLEKFEVGDEIMDLDPFNSYGGKIMPGLSNKWIKESTRYHGKNKKIPNLVIMLDDSNSMPNPGKEFSNAVLGSFVVSKEYLKNRAKIKIIRFSDVTSVIDYSDNKYEILEELIKFKGGKETHLDLSKINSEGNNDYVLITDGEISNANLVYNYLNKEISKGSRAYIFQISNKDIEKKIEYKDKIKIMYISKSEDLGNLILNDLRK